MSLSNIIEGAESKVQEVIEFLNHKIAVLQKSLGDQIANNIDLAAHSQLLAKKLEAVVNPVESVAKEVIEEALKPSSQEAPVSDAKETTVIE